MQKTKRFTVPSTLDNHKNLSLKKYLASVKEQVHRQLLSHCTRDQGLLLNLDAAVVEYVHFMNL